jgi:hypothetical protein
MAFGTLSVDRITSSDYTLIDNYIADSGRPLSNRNLIINGAMQVVQRNANTTSITTDGYYSPDRWNINISSSGTWTMNVDSAGVNRVGPEQFSNSCNLICTSADSSLSAGDFFIFQQRLEGLNVQQIEKGTAVAESVTVSWYAKSSNTGTYICELFDNDNTRQCSKSWTINVANTWEKKSVTFPADTTGRLDNDNLTSLILNFWLAAGTTWTNGALNTTWASTTSANRAVGQFNLAGNINNYIAITGVQLETGTVATPFEMRSIGQELALCQRYYQFIGGTAAGFPLWGGYQQANDEMYTPISFPVAMRAAPTTTKFGTWNTLGTATQPDAIYLNTQGYSIRLQKNGSAGIFVVHPNSTDDIITFSAEL